MSNKRQQLLVAQENHASEPTLLVELRNELVALKK